MFKLILNLKLSSLARGALASSKSVYMCTVRNIYEQGQYLDNGKIREYFYYMDHQGQLFLDDAKIKNFTSFVSFCGRERNYLRCDDLPFVITHLDETHDLVQVNQIKSANWMFKFDPKNLYHKQSTGRLYYLIDSSNSNPSDANFKIKTRIFDKIPCKLTLVRSDIGIHLMERIQISKHNENSFKLDYKSVVYDLNSDENSLQEKLLKKYSAFTDEII